MLRNGDEHFDLLKRGCLFQTLFTSLGKPPASSQQCARVFAEKPVFHCLSGSARNTFQSSALRVGIMILLIS